MTDVTRYFQRQIALYPEKYGIGSYVARELAGDMLEDPDTWGAGNMLLRLTTKILTGETVSEEQDVSTEFSAPATWWDHLMETLNRRLHLDIPVKYKTETRKARVKFSKKVTYPEANVSIPPEQFGRPVMWETVELVPETEEFNLDSVGRPSRYATVPEIVSAVYRDMSARSFLDELYPSPTHVMAWLAQHGVNPDQLVARSSIQ